eukprot:gnl/TRDRNA2_/TRDRNA2_169665_c2_seq1.p1 gnl/TRDRNA2_/TRDRNA2_169665_c2~~gnl/TRDRNA2_/TRDRNA2_169665_c2_seq1.p1  ORF type:complete len:399 (-),score=23.02 gnl/TRDRNA2_/TRDRNA2_169665_c2_seq1:132-1268(-)
MGRFQDEYHIYFEDSRYGQSVATECQRGTIYLRDPDQYILVATLQHRGCDWASKATEGPLNQQAAVVVDVVRGDCRRLKLPSCTNNDWMSEAGNLPGRWLLRGSPGTTNSPWADRVFNRGLDCIQDWPEGGTKGKDNFCWGISKCYNGAPYERQERPAMVWMPWSCELQPAIGSKAVGSPGYVHRDHSAIAECLRRSAHARGADKIYLVGESHMRDITGSGWLGEPVFLWLVDLCEGDALAKFSTMDPKRPVILAIGNWAVSRILGRRPLKELFVCIDEMVADLANLQAAGAMIRLGTPWSFCCVTPEPPRLSTYRLHGVIAQEIINVASKYGIPVWNIWEISNRWEEDTQGDFCNHQNSENYNLNFQILCNSLPGAI